jgi:hypothetical protein
MFAAFTTFFKPPFFARGSPLSAIPENVNVLARSVVGTDAALGAGAGAAGGRLETADAALGLSRPRLRLRLRRLTGRRRSRLRLRLRPRFRSFLAVLALVEDVELGAVDFLSFGGDPTCSLLGDGIVTALASLLWIPLSETSGAAGVTSGWIAAGATMAAALRSLAVEAEGTGFGSTLEADGATSSIVTLEVSLFATPRAASFFSLEFRRLEARGLDDRDRDRDRPLRGLRLRCRLDRPSLLALRGAERLRDDPASDNRRRWLRLLFLSLSRRLFLLALRFRWLAPPRSRDRDEPDEREELAERERLRPRVADRDLERALRRWLRLFFASTLSD